MRADGCQRGRTGIGEKKEGFGFISDGVIKTVHKEETMQRKHGKGIEQA